MSEFITETLADLGPVLLNVLAAVVVLIVGFLLAKIIGGLVGKALRQTNVDQRLSSVISSERPLALSKIIAKGVFYLVMLLAVIAALQILNLTFVTEPFNSFLNSVFVFFPKLIAAAALGAVAYIVATVLRLLVRRGLESANFDQRFASEDAESAPKLSETVSGAVYYLVFLLFLPAILGALSMQGLLQPVQGLVSELLAFLPNLFAAAVILLVGYFVAKLIRNIVSNLLAAAGANRLAEKVGISNMLGQQRLSDVLGIVVYVLVLLPVLVAALNALDVAAVTAPASQMLDMIMAAIPQLFAAAVVLVIAFVIGKIVGGLVSNLLGSVGFDRMLSGVGLLKSEAAESNPASRFVGGLVLAGIMLFAGMEAAGLLGFEALTSLLSQFLVFAGQIALGLVIFGFGLFVANLAFRLVRDSDINQAMILAHAARVAVMVLAAAMALSQMGIANSIINLAFGLILGAIAVAAAIAFGIGGKEFARGELERMSATMRKNGAARPRSEVTV